MGKHAITILLLVLFNSGAWVSAAYLYDDGEIHDIYGDHLNLGTTIKDSLDGNPTTLNLHYGSSSSSLYVYDHSIVNIKGGEWVYGLYTHDHSIGTVSAGKVVEISMDGQSSADISGGFIQKEVTVSELGTLNVTGGEIQMGIFSKGSGRVSILDGKIRYGIFAQEQSKVNIYGGLIDCDLYVRGVVTIYGADFNYDYGLIPVESGRLTGKLANGYPINTGFQAYDGGSIILVPEPTALVLIALGGLWLRRRKGMKNKNSASRFCSNGNF